MESLIGITLGQYEIRDKIGQGGMAHVFKAYQPGLDRLVAVKVLSPVMAEQPGFAERFQREAQSIARLQHPNILQVYDFGKHNGYYYIVMRYVSNSTTLDDLIRQKIPINELFDYIIQVADALNYAHNQKIIHRDVKPSNILVDGKWALLSDFGLVKMSESSSHLTSTGATVGTPAYMSPEQAVGKEVDYRTDIYALGVILYRVLTGTIPHDAPTPLAIAAKRSTEPVIPPRQIKPDIPESIEQVVLRSLSTAPENRFTTATDFALALQKADRDPNFRERTITDMTDDATVMSKYKVHPSAKRANTILVAVIAATTVLLVVVVGFAFFFFFSDSGNDISKEPSNSEAVAPIPPSTNTPTPSPTLTLAPGAPAALALKRSTVYSGPGTAYDLLGYLPEGTSAEIISRDETGKWWQIKFSLSPSGAGWVQADTIEDSDADNVFIAVAPPTPTGTPTPVPPSPTPTDTPIPDTPTPIPTSTPTPTRPTPTPTSTLPPTPMSSPTLAVSQGKFTLLEPVSLEQPSFGLTKFRWQWGSPLAENQGFEVRVWRDDEPPAGVHNAVQDNREGRIEALGNNTYRLVADITDTPGVRRRGGEYNWTVIVIQLDPYQELGIQADPPGRFRFDLPGGSGGGDGGGGDGGGGGGDPGSI